MALPPLPGDTAAGYVGAINGPGVAVGRSSLSGTFGDPESVVTWDTRSIPLEAVEIGRYSTGAYHIPSDINDSGVIVGKIYITSYFGFVHDGVTFHRLDERIKPGDPAYGRTLIAEVPAINNAGWIIARGSIGGTNTGMLLKPIPPTGAPFRAYRVVEDPSG